MATRKSNLHREIEALEKVLNPERRQATRSDSARRSAQDDILDVGIVEDEMLQDDDDLAMLYQDDDDEEACDLMSQGDEDEQGIEEIMQGIETALGGLDDDDDDDDFDDLDDEDDFDDLDDDEDDFDDLDDEDDILLQDDDEIVSQEVEELLQELEDAPVDDEELVVIGSEAKKGIEDEITQDYLSDVEDLRDAEDIASAPSMLDVAPTDYKKAMRNASVRLDRVATYLEKTGRAKLALHVDRIADAIDSQIKNNG